MNSKPLYIAFVVLLLCGFLALSPTKALASALFFSTPPKVVEEGDRLTIDVRVESNSQSINAISGALSYPADLLRAVSVSKNNSIVNLWTREPKIVRDRIVFEGVVMNPGFQSNSGLVLRATFEAKKAGTAALDFSEGALLANDGLGTNVLVSLNSTNFKIVARKPVFDTKPIAVAPTTPVLPTVEKIVALPVITEYSPLVTPTEEMYVKGRGEPGALTKIVFKDISAKSLGERFIAMLQTKKKTLDEVLVSNNETGAFQYVSPKNLVAGVYNATPFLVEKETSLEKPGFGVQLLVNDSKIVRYLVVAINVLALVIPIVGLLVIIYFIPWYSWRKMRVIKKKLTLEEEQIEISGHQLERQDKILDKTVDKLVDEHKTPS